MLTEPSEFLRHAEVRELAGCVGRDAQCAKLTTLGVPFKRDGERILVSRALVRLWIAGEDFRPRAGGFRLDLVT